MNGKNYICPFCKTAVAATDNTYKEEDFAFNYLTGLSKDSYLKSPAVGNMFNIIMQNCPACGEVSFLALGKHRLEGKKINLFPSSILVKKFPEYIPKAIIQDYEEAYSILDLSPKASATLCRRCLQGIIRDFWKTNEKTLYDEISVIQSKIPETQWKAINSIREIGNIGAHMKKDIDIIIDVDKDEAFKLLKLIELLIEKWYIARHDEEQLYEDITKVEESKKEEEKLKVTEKNNK